MTRDIAKGLIVLSLLAGCGSGDERQSAQTATPAGQQSTKAVASSSPAGVKVSLAPATPLSCDCLTIVVSGRVTSGKISWFLDSELVQEGESSQYCVPEGARGKTVKVVLGEALDGPGTSVTVGNAPPEVLDTQLKLIVEGEKRYLESLPVARDIDQDVVTFTYKWYVNGEPDQSQTENRLDIGNIKRGDLVKLEILPNDGTVAGPLYATLESPVPGSPPRIISTPPTKFKAVEFVYQVKGTDPDGDQLTYSLEKPPQGAVIDAKTGLINWPLTRVAPGEYKLTIVVTDSEEQKARQEFSINVTKQAEGN
jgi:hypothetical protein